MCHSKGGLWNPFLVLRQISFSRRAGAIVKRILMKPDDGRVELFQGKASQNSLTDALKNGKNIFAGALVKAKLSNRVKAF